VALRRLSPPTPDAMSKGDSLPLVQRHLKLFKSFLLCSAFVWMPSRVNICAVRRYTAEDNAVLWMRIDAQRPNLDCAPIAFGVGSGIAGRLLLANLS
jgi:hypothetical protein